jgi:hypothetical protein
LSSSLLEEEAMEVRFGPSGAFVPEDSALIPAGVPVRRGRLSLRGVAPRLASSTTVDVVAGLRSACWLGAPGRAAPGIGRLSHRSVATIDDRRRVVLDRQVRAYLAVDDGD